MDAGGRDFRCGNDGVSMGIIHHVFRIASKNRSKVKGCPYINFSRYIVHWDLRERMTERDTETIVQRAVEKFPDAKPRLISDNGPQFIARDFNAFIRQCGMTHVKTSPYYPQSNGRIERWHGTLKTECIRPGTPLSLEDGRRIVGQWVVHYNTVRLHSAIDYIAPKDNLEGRAESILAARDAKLAAAREQRPKP